MTAAAKHYQPMNTFFHQNVAPLQKSSIILSGGEDRPYFYSLGNQSTVPYVQLQGSGGTQKLFTWGETIEVLPGQNVQVQSASYMAGDIQIQSGRDIANRPARITTPIEVSPAVTTGVDGTYGPSVVVTPLYPCDCRGARRAYLGCQFLSPPTLDGSMTLQLIGINQQHSWPGSVSSQFTAIAPTGKKYFWLYEFVGNTTYTQIPLGFGAQTTSPNAPMTLADYVLWTWTIGTAANLLLGSFFYTLEYA
jgi:hypothetical protein